MMKLCITIVGLFTFFEIVWASSGPKELYYHGRFQSDWCTSPLVTSIAPFWRFNDITLNDAEINRYFGGIVERNNTFEGHHQARLTIPTIKLILNGSTVACLFRSDSGVIYNILDYRFIIVEAKWMNVTNKTFVSDLCVSPADIPLPPYFTYNNITLNDNEVNKYYQAEVSRNVSSEGYHQAMLSISTVNSTHTLNNSNITCWVNQTVIFRYHLIDIDVDQSGTTSAMESGTISDAINGVTQDVNIVTVYMDASSKLSDSSDDSLIAAVTCTILVVLFIIGVTFISWYIWKQGKCRRTNTLESVESPPDDSIHPPPPSISQPPISPIPQIPDEHQGPTVTQQVTGVSGGRRVPQRMPGNSFSRLSVETTCTMTNAEDPSVLDTTTSTYLHPLNYSYEVREDESETLMLPPAVPKSREEQGTGEGQSLAVPSCDGSKMQSAYDSLGVTKCWNPSIHGSTRHCQFVQCGSSGISDEGKDEKLEDD